MTIAQLGHAARTGKAGVPVKSITGRSRAEITAAGRRLLLHVVNLHETDSGCVVLAAHDRGIRAGLEVCQDDGGFARAKFRQLSSLYASDKAMPVVPFTPRTSEV